MMRTLLASGLFAAAALLLPGSSQTAAAANGGKIKIASLVPRGSELDKALKKLGAKMSKMTDGAWDIKFYPSGVAGDETDVIRKMNVGQMDASIVSTVGLSQIVREASVLDAPGAIQSYKGLDKVKTELWPEMEKAFQEKGMRLLGWSEGGQYRYFSKKPVKKYSELKNMRPWLWPASHVHKELFETVGITGVPLGVPEVYGALQTNMVDVVLGTSIAATGLQWWSKVTHVTDETFGILMLGFVITEKRWKELPTEVQEVIQKEIQEQTRNSVMEIRKDDLVTYKKLTSRGLTAVKWDDAARKEYDAYAAKVRDRLTGRLYPKALLERVVKLGSQN